MRGPSFVHRLAYQCRGGLDRALAIIGGQSGALRKTDVILVIDGISSTGRAAELRTRATGLQASVLGIGIGPDSQPNSEDCQAGFGCRSRPAALRPRASARQRRSPEDLQMPINLLRQLIPRPPSGHLMRRLRKHGAEPLSDAELLAVLLHRKELQPLQRLVDSFGSLRALLTAAPSLLEHHETLGPQPTATLLAAVELGRRLREDVDVRPCLCTPEAVYAYLAPRLEGLRREVVHVLCLDTRNVLIWDERVAEGSTDHAAVDPREVFSIAMVTRAPAIILAHSHPSGSPTPSSLDVEMTSTLVRAAGLLRIRVVDHVIIGHRSYHSMATAGQLPEQKRVDWMAAP